MNSKMIKALKCCRPGTLIMVLSIICVAALAQISLADTIRVGAPIPITGPFSSDGKAMEKGLRLAVEKNQFKRRAVGEEIGAPRV